jgi:hypothetical protein
MTSCPVEFSLRYTHAPDFQNQNKIIRVNSCPRVKFGASRRLDGAPSGSALRQDDVVWAQEPEGVYPSWRTIKVPLMFPSRNEAFFRYLFSVGRHHCCECSEDRRLLVPRTGSRNKASCLFPPCRPSYGQVKTKCAASWRQAQWLYFLGSCPLAEKKLPENQFLYARTQIGSGRIKIVDVPKYVRTETVSSILRPHAGMKMERINLGWEGC